MYARKLAGREFTFDFGAGLVKDNLLLVDRETDSVWSQLANQAITGEMTGTDLQPVVSMQTTWKFWRQRHPDTRVMVQHDQLEGRPYFYHDFVPGARRGERPHEHDTATLGLGFANAAGAVYFPFAELAQSELPVHRSVGGREIRVHYDAEGLTAWVTRPNGDRLSTVLVYAGSWRQFFPDSEFYQASK